MPWMVTGFLCPAARHYGATGSLLGGRESAELLLDEAGQSRSDARGRLAFD